MAMSSDDSEDPEASELSSEASAMARAASSFNGDATPVSWPRKKLSAEGVLCDALPDLTEGGSATSM